MNKDIKKDWRKKAREYLAAAFGGKCTICGYDKTIAALDYHHVDADSKDHELSRAMKNGHAWSKIAQEAKKCTILCCRCHRELHAGVTTLPLNYAKFNEEYTDIWKLKTKEFDACPVCGVEKWKRYKHCSTKCAKQKQKKFEVTKEELESLLRTNSYVKVGKMFGVSDNAVRNRCKSLGVKTEIKRGYWLKKKNGL